MRGGRCVILSVDDRGMSLSATRMRRSCDGGTRERRHCDDSDFRATPAPRRECTAQAAPDDRLFVVSFRYQSVHAPLSLCVLWCPPLVVKLLVLMQRLSRRRPLGAAIAPPRRDSAGVRRWLRLRTARGGSSTVPAGRRAAAVSAGAELIPRRRIVSAPVCSISLSRSDAARRHGRGGGRPHAVAAIANKERIAIARRLPTSTASRRRWSCGVRGQLPRRRRHGTSIAASGWWPATVCNR